MDRIRVVIVDDQELFVQGLRSVLQARAKGEIEVVGVAYNGRDAVDLLRRVKADVALVDIKMPIMDGVELTAQIVKNCPGTHVIVLTSYGEEAFVREALSKGAVGYLLKETQPSNLIMAILAVKEGSVLISPAVATKLVRGLDPKEGEKEVVVSEKWIEDLTRREKQVLLFLSQGYNNEEISKKLSIEEQTVRNHVSMIYSKIGIHDRIELMLAVNRIRK